VSQPVPKPQISRAEMRAIYAQGEEAVIALVEGLLERIEQLEGRIEGLENQGKKDSRNSSKPPSSDGFKKRTQSLRKKSERQSGGQPGHPGSTLEWSEAVDQIIAHPALHCQACGTSLNEVEVERLEGRQVHDLPPLRLEISEHQAEVKRCPHCQWENRAAFPADVNSVVQYGAGIKGLMVYLLEGQLLPSARVCQLMSEVFACELSEGTLYSVRERCFEALAPVELAVKTALQAAEVVHFDETGMRVKGQLFWLHVACTHGLTYYFIHPKRGTAAMDEMDILPHFQGISVHDGFSSYAQYDCEHSACNAHHLRDLIFIVERYQQPWAQEMIDLLRAGKHQVEEAMASEQTTLAPEVLAELEARYQTILEQGLEANPPPPPPPPETAKKKGRKAQTPAKNLLDRLQSQKEQVLRFLYDFRVPFDNNQAERDIRMVKLKQKISGGFRSQEGAQWFGRIRGYLSTMRKQGQKLLDVLRQVFLGQPVLPSLQPK
jgi:transposase